MRIPCLCLALALSLPAHAVQPVSMTFDGCVDEHGAQVAARPAPAQAAFVETRLVDGRAELHYNPDALPGRKELTRLFLFAQACARHNLGIAGGTISPDEARRADCWGLTTLLRSRLVGDEQGVAAIQADLDLGADEWTRLPGPPRRFELASCYREALRLPSAAAPGASQVELNACLHGCGDRLFHCQGGALSAGGSCMHAFDTCSAACGD